MPEQLTADESAAMEAMKADTGPEVDVADVVDVPEAPAPVETPAPVAETPAPEADKPPPGMVPQGALHQERERRKAAEGQVQDFQRQMAEMQAQIAKLTAPPPAEIVVPDPVLQPEAFKKFQIDQIKERAAERAAQEQQARENAAEQHLLARVDRDVRQFKATTPDYDQAYQYIEATRRQELAFFGNSPDQIDQQIEVDVRAIVQQAYTQGKNPGEVFYGYAKARGYSPAQAAAQPAPQAAAQVQALAEAQRQTASMGTAGGPSNDGGVTIETLAKMTEAQLAKMPKAERDAMMQKVMGG